MDNTNCNENPLLDSSSELGKSHQMKASKETKTISDISDLKLSLENEGTQKVIELMKTNPVVDTTFQQSLIGIMQSGNAKFVEKTGRNLTYSEMRELYG